jgi:hypothetical protein
LGADLRLARERALALTAVLAGRRALVSAGVLAGERALARVRALAAGRVLALTRVLVGASARACPFARGPTLARAVPRIATIGAGPTSRKSQSFRAGFQTFTYHTPLIRVRLGRAMFISPRAC